MRKPLHRALEVERAEAGAVVNRFVRWATAILPAPGFRPDPSAAAGPAGPPGLPHGGERPATPAGRRAGSKQGGHWIYLGCSAVQ